MNVTNATEEVDIFPIVLSPTAKGLTLVLCSVFFLGLFANMLLIWTFTTIKRLRTPHNALIMNLSFADIIIIGYILPCNMIAIIIGFYPLPNDACRFNGAVAYICFTTSINSLMIIALNRYVKICKSQYYARIFTNSITALIISLGWFLGIILVIPYLLFEDGIIFDQTLQMCVFNRYVKGPYPIISMILAIPLPISITCVCYIAIYRHFQQVKSQLIQVLNNSMAKASLLQNIALARSCFVVFLTSIIAFTPFGITSIFFGDASEISLGVHLFSIYLCFANSAANSVIYGIMNRNIREGYKEKLSCLFTNNVVHSDDMLRETNRPDESLKKDHRTYRQGVNIQGESSISRGMKCQEDTV